MDQAAAILDLDVGVAAKQAAEEHAKEILQRVPRDELVCPITQELFEHPVVACDGFTYERAAIEKHFQRRRVSPKTNLPIESTAIIHNHTVHSLVADWVEEQASLWPPALARLIEAEELVWAEKICDKCDLVTRFPLKQRHAFLETMMALPLHHCDFKERHEEFVQVHMEATGASRQQAVVKAHRLARGDFAYGQAAIDEDLRFLMFATRSAQNFEIAIPLPPPGGCKKQEVESSSFEVLGFGECKVKVMQEPQEDWMAFLSVYQFGPEMDMRPLIFSLRSDDTGLEVFWRSYGVGSYEPCLLRAAPCDTFGVLTLQVVVRGMDAPVVRVGVEE